MKTPEEISQAIRDDYFRRYGSYKTQALNEDTLDTLIVGAVSPLCQRIDTLQEALRDLLSDFSTTGYGYLTCEDEARLRSILGGS